MIRWLRIESRVNYHVADLLLEVCLAKVRCGVDFGVIFYALDLEPINSRPE